jgi:hypothetical protein
LHLSINEPSTDDQHEVNRLAEAGLSTPHHMSSGSQPDPPVPITDVSPLPSCNELVSLPANNKKRAKGQTAVLTSSPYKVTLEIKKKSSADMTVTTTDKKTASKRSSSARFKKPKDRRKNEPKLPSSVEVRSDPSTSAACHQPPTVEPDVADNTVTELHLSINEHATDDQHTVNRSAEEAVTPTGKKTASKRSSSARFKKPKDKSKNEPKRQKKTEELRPPKPIECRQPLPRKPSWLANHKTAGLPKLI